MTGQGYGEPKSIPESLGHDVRVWTHDGTWFHLDADRYSLHVLASRPEPFELAVDVEVHTDTQRWSATFITPEQMRECLDNWIQAGEWESGTFLWIPDGVVVPELTLETIAAVVDGAVDPQGQMEEPFTLLDEDDE